MKRKRLLWVLLALASVQAARAESRVEGTVLDTQGKPVPECRVIARDAEGSTVYVSPPSDGEGRYAVEVPGAGSYVLVALIAPSGARIELEEPAPFTVGATPAKRDITMPLTVAPDPRSVQAQPLGVDRFFLAFVEDPVLARTRHFEATAEYADVDSGHGVLVGGVAAMQFEAVPQVEWGARWALADRDFDGGDGGSGATDLDIWGKFDLWRSQDTRADLAVGMIATLPLGDEAKGLGSDALQSKLFAGASYAWRSFVLIADVGVAFAEDGTRFGTSLDGKIAPSLGAGLLVPFARDWSAVFEVNYEGERFEDTPADANLLAGVNWRLLPHGHIRAAASFGLGETSELARLIAGYVFAY